MGMEQREFLVTIKACRRRLNLAGFLKNLIFALCVGAGAGIVFETAAFVTPLYYADIYAGTAVLLAVPAAFAAACMRRGTMEQAALVMDGFGFEERIITAYENRDKDGTLIVLQRQDAMRRLSENRSRIRIPIWPSWKSSVLSLCLLAVLTGLAFVPSPVKDRARELHGIREEAGEKEKEIEEILESLMQLEQETLTQEQQAALQEMQEMLQSSIQEHQQADSAAALAAAGEKLNYKYENMSSQLSNLAQSLQNGATASAASADSMQAMAEKLQEMSGMEPSGGNQTASNQGQGGQEGQNGQNGSNGTGSQNSQNGSNGQDGQNGQSGGQGDGSGQGQGGQGDGSGQGSGQGDGSSQGQGGQGDGSGSGRGTGSSSASHDYVSVPNAIADSGNLTGNSVDHDASQYFRTQTGLSWEGTHVSHEAVIGSYERNAYEGISAGRYPSGMEDVIKKYFASFN